MKIRIQDSSLRFRLTLREVESFAAQGRLARTMQVVGPAGPGGRFEYALEHDPALPESAVRIDGPSITIRLSSADRATLLQPEEEGVYLRREWQGPQGEVQRFMAFVEKDRPGSTCIKPEAWIYDAPPGGPVVTQPIPAKSGPEVPRA